MKKIPPNGFDPAICATCWNKGKTCTHICAPLVWIDGRKGRKESLLTEPVDDYERPDYNIALHSLMRGIHTISIEDVRSIKPLTVRAIAAMLLADMEVPDIATVMQISRQHIYRLVKGQ